MDVNKTTEIDDPNFYQPATIGQINMLRDEFIKARDIFKNQLEDMKNYYKLELEEKDKKIKNLQTRNLDLEKRLNITEFQIKDQSLLIDETEQYSRRHSHRFHGLETNSNESPSDIVSSVKEEIKRMNLPIEDFEIDRAHRSGPVYTDKYWVKQQAVICKFISWKARHTMFTAKKKSKFYMKADLTKNRHNIYVCMYVYEESDVR